jgi:glycosyltransferase involved in cell wall biosynthesis
MRRVLHVIPSVSRFRGGPSAMVRQIAGGLAQLGIDAHVASTNDDGRATSQVPCGVPVRHSGATYWYFPRQTRFYTFSWPLTSWLAANISSFDLVHIHALFSYAALPAAFHARRHGVPYVVRPLGTLNKWGMLHRRPWLKAASFKLLESRIVDNAALMHYTSEQERAEAESLGVRTPSAVIPNPLPEIETAVRGEYRRTHPEIGCRPMALFLSRIDPKKGLDLLLRAFGEVRNQVPEAVLVVAGDHRTEHGKAMQSLASSLNLNGSVVWHGFAEGAEKASLFADADVFVLPSRSENFGIAVAEAMAAGLPVVVSDQVAIHQDVVSAYAGIRTRCEAAEVATAVRHLLVNAESRRVMGANGVRFAQAHYSSRAVTRQLVHAYEGLLE